MVASAQNFYLDQKATSAVMGPVKNRLDEIDRKLTDLKRNQRTGPSLGVDLALG